MIHTTQKVLIYMINDITEVLLIGVLNNWTQYCCFFYQTSYMVVYTRL